MTTDRALQAVASRAVRAGDVVMWAGGIAFVLAVDAVRGRALLALDESSPPFGGRRWEWLSMLTPLPAKRCAANLLTAFVSERCELGSGLWVVSAELRAAYRDYCQKTGLPALGWGAYGNPATVRQSLLRLGVFPGMRWIGPSRQRSKVRIWRGIRLK